ncbi:Fe-only nitrogenase accessory protein AnfO [Opitutaceae bacterium TAV1]|nr:Fe-only nitrogenase accessory protein AnfO [Opitutaceae bacterium TAV1]
MKIAAYVNEEGKAVSFNARGMVRIYKRRSGIWVNMTGFPLELRRDAGLAEFQAAFTHMIARLEDCRIFIVDEIRGVPCAILDSMGFRLWQVAGPVLEQLDLVAGKTQEEADNATSASRAPVPVGDPRDGFYRLNLRQVLRSDASLNSRQVLIPFLEAGAFRKLEVLCDHTPRWMEKELERLHLRADSEDWETSGVRITLSPDPDSATGRSTEHRHALPSGFSGCGGGRRSCME